MTTKELKIPLLIDAGLALLIVFSAGMGWANLAALADDVKELKAKELPERVVRIETQVDTLVMTSERIEKSAETTQDLMRDLMRKVE